MYMYIYISISIYIYIYIYMYVYMIRDLLERRSVMSTYQRVMNKCI